MNLDFNIIRPDDSYQAAILELYRAAAIQEGLARRQHEITDEYVSYFCERAQSNGLQLIALSSDKTVLGEVHGFTMGIETFAHVLSNVTIAIHPTVQGKGLGRKLFQEFLNQVNDELQNFQRVELIARSSNKKAIQLYESLGFKKEGVFKNRIQGVDGKYEDDIPMAWLREQQVILPR